MVDFRVSTVTTVVGASLCKKLIWHRFSLSVRFKLITINWTYILIPLLKYAIPLIVIEKKRLTPTWKCISIAITAVVVVTLTGWVRHRATRSYNAASGSTNQEVRLGLDQTDHLIVVTSQHISCSLLDSA